VNQTQEIFKKISSPEERAKTVDEMINKKVEIFCKGAKDEVFKLIADRMGGHQQLVCVLHDTETGEPEIPNAVVCQFSLSGEKYFFKSQLDHRLNRYLLDLTGDFFQLQRRQSYRIRVPLATRSGVDITHKETKKTHKAIPVDLSTGGCKLQFATNELPWKVDDKVDLYLKVGDREPLQLAGNVRHVKVEATPKTAVFVGVQFENISPTTEKSLFSITMELYREFFSRIE
jgi:hypothetical protein